MELSVYAEILANPENSFVISLEKLALKKSAKNEVFKHIKNICPHLSIDFFVLWFILIEKRKFFLFFLSVATFPFLPKTHLYLLNRLKFVNHPKDSFYRTPKLPGAKHRENTCLVGCFRLSARIKFYFGMVMVFIFVFFSLHTLDAETFADRL